MNEQVFAIIACPRCDSMKIYYELEALEKELARRKQESQYKKEEP